MKRILPLLALTLFLIPFITNAQGNALNFDGVNDYVNLTTTSLPTSGNVTVEAWVNVTAFEAGVHEGVIFDKTGTTADQHGYILRCGGSGQLQFVIGSTTTWAAVTSPTGVLTTGQWYHVAATYSGSALTLYINGNQVATSASSLSLFADSDSNIGRAPKFPTSRLFDGKIDEVRIWSDERTELEINTNMDNPLVGNEAGLAAYYNFNSSSGTVLSDLSANTNNGTLEGMDDTDWVESYALVMPMPADITTFDSTSFTLNWTAPETGVVDSYYIDVDDNADFSSPLASYTLFDAGADTNEVVTGLNPSTTYYARVRAYKSSAGQVGTWSEVKSVTTTAASAHDAIVSFTENTGTHPIPNDRMHSLFFTMPSGGDDYDLRELGVNIDASSGPGNVKMAIYDSTDNLLYQTAEFSVTGGVAEYVSALIPSGNVTLVKGELYWVSIIGNPSTATNIAIEASQTVTNLGVATGVATSSWSITAGNVYPIFPEPRTHNIAWYRAVSLVVQGDAIVPNPPTFTSSPTTSLDEGDPYSYDITTEDLDGDAMTVTAPTLPSWLTLTNGYEVTTLAGNGTRGYATGSGADVMFDYPKGVTTDAAGNVYVADYYNQVIRKVTPAGVVSIFAGTLQTSGWPVDGPVLSAIFNYPGKLIMDSSDTMYITEGNSAIRKITGGMVSTLVGSNTRGNADGIGVLASFRSPDSFALSPDELTLYMSDSQNHNIRKINLSTLEVTTIAGSAVTYPGELGYVDAIGTAARFEQPHGIALDPTGTILYIADSNNFKIRKMDLATGEVTTLAGSTNGYADGTGTSAKFNYPSDIIVAPNGNLYISSNSGNIRMSTPAGVVTTVIGPGTLATGLVDGVGTDARFKSVQTITMDAAGDLYIAAYGNHAVRKITKSLRLSGDSSGQIGTHTVQLKVTDATGEFTTQNFTIEVLDVTPPTAICQDITVQLDATGSVTIVAADVDNNSTDNVGIDSYSIDIDTFTCTDVGTPVTVTLTVTDAAGLSDTCTATVTVEDSIDPAWDVAPSDMTSVECDSATNAAAFTTWLVSFSGTDNCGSAVVTNNSTGLSDDCGVTGTETVTFTLDDGNGNSITADATFTIVDTTTPTIDVAASDLTVECDGAGNVEDLANWLSSIGTTGSVADACSEVATPLYDLTSGTETDDVHDEDDDSEEHNLGFDFTFFGNTFNSVYIGSNGTLSFNNSDDYCCDGDPLYDGSYENVIAFMNTDLDPEEEDDDMITYQTLGVAPNREFVVSYYQVPNYDDNDLRHNGQVILYESTGIIDIYYGGHDWVLDSEMTIGISNETGTIGVGAAGWVEFDNIVEPTHFVFIPNGISYDLSNWSNNFTALSDGCGNTGSALVTFTATDECGNLNTTSATFTIEDTTNPTWTVAPTDMTGIEYNPETNAAAFTTWLGSFSGDDNAGTATVTNNSSGLGDLCGGTETVTFTLTDACGNAITQDASFTIVDVTPPAITCSEDITVVPEPEHCGAGAIVIFQDAVAIDECGSVFVYQYDGLESGSFFPMGDTVIKYRAIDNSANVSTCSFTITVEDNLAPVIVCPPNEVVGVESNGTYTLGNYIESGIATVTDNCTDPVTIFSQDPAAGSLLGSGLHDISFTAEDEYGNVTTCSFELNIQEVLGVNENELGALALYPNPASNFVILSNPQSLTLNKVAIYDLTGRLVQNVDLTNMGTEISIDISTLASATYMMIISGEKGQVIKRLIRE